VRRALKVLADREVSPQLGLLKSTLLQLDSTFSERTYGAGSFRDFAQKLASAGHVVLRESGRNVLVELSDSPITSGSEDGRAQPPAPEAAPEAVHAPTNGSGRAADGIREIRRLLQSPQRPPRWPMYIRQLKQYLRAVDPNFDERRYGFETLGDLMRACQRDGLLRIERDRQGGMRIFPGNIGQPSAAASASQAEEEGQTATDAVASEAAETSSDVWGSSIDASTADVVEGDVVQEREVPGILDAEEAPAPAEKPVRRRQRVNTRTNRLSAEPRAARKPAEAPPVARARKTASKPRASRVRPRTDASSD
jgi:hypothetical protein